jgi:hypothetical protein
MGGQAEGWLACAPLRSQAKILHRSIERVSATCGIPGNGALTCGGSSRDFSSTHGRFCGHVPWMCPDPLLAKYAQAVGQRRSPGLVITARPSGSARVGSRSGRPLWSAITDPATSSRTNPGAITDRALVPVDLGKQSAVVQECPGVSVVNCHAANHGW